MVLSIWASSTIEEVAQSSPEGLRWCHIYMLADNDNNLSLIRRAEKEGYKALVITVDAPYRGPTTKDPLKLPPHLTYINIEAYQRILKNPELATPEEIDGINPKNTWNMISWLR
jgi:(S)-2-hydroxy-acid oxidase